MDNQCEEPSACQFCELIEVASNCFDRFLFQSECGIWNLTISDFLSLSSQTNTSHASPQQRGCLYRGLAPCLHHTVDKPANPGSAGGGMDAGVGASPASHFIPFIHWRKTSLISCSGSSLQGVECFSGVDSCHQWFSWRADDSIWWDLTWSFMCCFPLCWIRSRQEQCKSDRRCGGLRVRGGQAVGTNEQAHRTTRAKGCLETDGPWYFRTDWMAGSGFCFYCISAVCYLDSRRWHIHFLLELRWTCLAEALLNGKNVGLTVDQR